MCLSPCAGTCIDDANATAGETARPFIKAVAPKQLHSSLLKKKSQFHLRMSQSINFIKCSPLSTHLKNILMMKWEVNRKRAHCIPKYNGYLQEKPAIVQLSGLPADCGSFSMKRHFHVEGLTYQLQLLRLGYLAGVFSKMYKVKLLLQGKQQTVFFPMIKYKLPVKIRILENISTTVGLAASQFSQIFLMRLVIF